MRTLPTACAPVLAACVLLACGPSGPMAAGLPAATDAAQSDAAAQDGTSADQTVADTARPQGDATAADGSDARPAATLATTTGPWCQAFAAWACKRAAGCACTLPQDHPFDEPTCRGTVEILCDDMYDKWSKGMAAGMVALDTSAMAACLDSLDSYVPSCVLPSKSMIETLACRKMIVSHPDAPACAIDNLPCSDGSICGDDGQCGGSRRVDGDSCQHGIECQSGACDIDTEKCVAAKGLGSSCAEDDAYLCPPLSACMAGACTGPKPKGTACTATGQCDVGLACIGGVCAAPASKSCQDDADCGSGSSCLPTTPAACQPHFCAKLWGE